MNSVASNIVNVSHALNHSATEAVNQVEYVFSNWDYCHVHLLDGLCGQKVFVKKKSL